MKFLILLCFSSLICFPSFSECNVFLIMPEIGGASVNASIYVNGEQITDLNGSVKKTINPVASIKYPVVTHNDCFRKLIFLEEEKVIIGLEVEMKNPVTGDIQEFKTEYPIDLEDDQNYFILMSNYGKIDIKMKEITFKEATKKLKKIEELPSITVEL